MNTLFFTVIMLALFLYVLARNRTQRASLKWPSTPASIVRIDYRDDEGWRPVIVYTYSVEGLPFKGDRWDFTDRSFATKKDAQSAVERVPSLGPGVIPVRYDPGRPDRSVVQPGGKPTSIALILFVWVSFYASVFGWFTR